MHFFTLLGNASSGFHMLAQRRRHTLPDHPVDSVVTRIAVDPDGWCSMDGYFPLDLEPYFPSIVGGAFGV